MIPADKVKEKNKEDDDNAKSPVLFAAKLKENDQGATAIVEAPGTDPKTAADAKKAKDKKAFEDIKQRIENAANYLKNPSSPFSFRKPELKLRPLQRPTYGDDRHGDHFITGYETYTSDHCVEYIYCEPFKPIPGQFPVPPANSIYCCLVHVSVANRIEFCRANPSWQGEYYNQFDDWYRGKIIELSFNDKKEVVITVSKFHYFPIPPYILDKKSKPTRS